MARIETDPNYSSPTFSRATASTDLFKKEDVQALAAAVSTHVHDGAGKGLALVAGSIPNGTITSAMIADGTIVAGDIADGAITSAKILDGTIATADLAAGAVSNAKLASDTARDNLLTNGGVEVWARGVGPFSTGFTADRWAVLAAVTSTVSVSRITSTIGAPGYSAQVVYTHSASGLVQFGQKLEDVGGQLSGRAITFAVTVKASVVGTARLKLQGVTSATSATSAYNTTTGSERLTVTYTPGGTDLNGVYAMLEMNVATATVEVNDATVVVGAAAADYAPLHPADEVARCQRYYEILGGDSSEIIVASHVSGANISYYETLVFATTKAATPTVTKVGTWTLTNAAQPAIGSFGKTAIRLDGSSGPGGVAGSSFAATVAGAFYVSAEANP